MGMRAQSAALKLEFAIQGEKAVSALGTACKLAVEMDPTPSATLDLALMFASLAQASPTFGAHRRVGALGIRQCSLHFAGPNL